MEFLQFSAHTLPEQPVREKQRRPSEQGVVLSGPGDELLYGRGRGGGVGKGLKVALPVKLVMEVTLGCSKLVLAFDFSCLEACDKLPFIGV